MTSVLRLSSVIFLLPMLAAAAPVRDLDQPLDWPGFIARQDMEFRQLPQDWTEAPHFGNAMIGSMWYQAGEALCMQVFRADVHDHRGDEEGWVAYSRPRLEIGRFLLETVGKPIGCQWRKDLWNAEMTGEIRTTAGVIRIRHLVHARDMVILTELDCDEGERACRWTWHPAPARSTRPGTPVDEASVQTYLRKYGNALAGRLQAQQPNPAGRMESPQGAQVWVQDLLAGGQYATAMSEERVDGRRVHRVSIANSHPGRTAAAEALAELGKGREDMTAWIDAHRQWWHDYYQRSYVSIPDRALERLYWQTIYRFGCTSRTGRCMVDTAGLWFQGQSWPYFTADWNIQSAHWPVYAANRLEQGQALVDRLHEQRQALIDAVQPAAWRDDCAYLPLAVAWDLRGSRDGDMRYHELVGNLPWAMHNAWLQYRYSMDDDMLRLKIYPLLRRSINLYLRMLREEADGRLHLPPTYSPETGVWADCNFDLALLKWGCHTLLKASARLGIDDPLAPKWREVIARLPDYPADEHGFMLGRDQTSSPNHQHFSNLLMIYPLHLVHIGQADRREVMRRSLERAISTAGPGQRQAMVQAHAGPMAATMGLGERALESLQKLAVDLYPNGLWYPSPCLESSLAAANIIQEMMIQSWSDPAAAESGPIRIFPALPAAWKDAEFRCLRAEGAFLVSAVRADGRTRSVKIHSLAGEPCRVLADFGGRPQVIGQREHTLRQRDDGTWEIDLRRGESVELVRSP